MNKDEPKGFENLQAPRLTAESLLKHDALLGSNSFGAEDDADIQSLGQTNKTFDTFASSVWSQCSSSSFGHLLPRFNAGNAKHKEMLAILSAIAEVIKEPGHCTVLQFSKEGGDKSKCFRNVCDLLSLRSGNYSLK